MAFKSVDTVNDERYHNMFRITDDGKSADVIFLYRSKADMLAADVHYIKSTDYSGYIHCLGAGCPACSKGIPVQANKVFIPVYNIGKGTIEFWDRTMTFEPQMQKDVFDRFPNPSEYVFRITRHGAYRDRNTRYDIDVVGKNAVMSYDEILAKFNATMPDYYENIVRSISISELTSMLMVQNSSGASEVNQDYVPIPRAGYQSSIPETFVDASEAVNIPTDAPEVEDAVAPEADGDDELPDPVF